MSPNVAIFWDYENCALPALEPSYAIVNRIRRLAHQYGSVKSFKAYLEYPEHASLKSLALRSELTSCGVSLIDCPHNGRKDVADKMILIDMMAYAIDNPSPTTIVLISGDRDFVYAVSILSLRQYRVVLLAPRAAHGSLKAQASAVYNWPDDVLPDYPPPAESGAPTSRPRRPSRSSPATLEDFWRGRSQCITPPSTTYSWSAPPSDACHPGWGLDDAAAQPCEPEKIQSNSGVESTAEEGSFPHPAEKLEEDAVLDKEQSPATASSLTQLHDERERGDSKAPGPVPVSWASIAQLSPHDAAVRATSPVSRKFAERGDSFPINAPPATPFVLNTTLPTKSVDVTDDALAAAGDAWDGPGWQTCSRAAKKRAALPSEFKPLVRVLKRQLAEGVAQVESSQLGQFLSQEVPRLSSIYERAGVARLKEYTALAAEQGIVVMSREGADGHNYVALHPAFRRKGAVL